MRYGPGGGASPESSGPWRGPGRPASPRVARVLMFTEKWSDDHEHRGHRKLSSVGTRAAPRRAGGGPRRIVSRAASGVPGGGVRTPGQVGARLRARAVPRGPGTAGARMGSAPETRLKM